MKRFTIWQNRNLNIEDFKDYLEEEYPDADEQDQYRIIDDLNYQYLGDERMNLNITVESGNIIAIADLGFWYGRKSGYKFIPSGNIADCLYSDCNHNEWYVDRYNNLRCIASHHDGTNHYLYREVKPGITETQLENFTDKIYNGTVKPADITRYTKALGPYIREVYGL